MIDRHSKINESRINDHRILVVDDDNQIQRLLSRVISLLGYSVSLASNGVEGLHEFFSKHHDIVFTDLEMPVMDGVNLVYNIKALSPCTPVVLMTGYGRKEVMERLSGNHVDHILFKPFKMIEVKDFIEKCFKSHHIRISGNGNYLNRG